MKVLSLAVWLGLGSTALAAAIPTLAPATDADADVYHIDGVSYIVFGNPSPWNDAQASCAAAGHDLAVFPDAGTYNQLVNNLSTSHPNSSTFYIGVKKHPFDPYLRTVGGRVVRFSHVLYGIETQLALEACVYIQLDNSTHSQSFWNLESNCSNGTDRFYICMNKRDRACSNAEGDNCNGQGFSRKANDYCFWDPMPQSMVPRYKAEQLCKQSGGSIFNAYDQEDLDLISNNRLFRTESRESFYWTGLTQPPHTGAPRWQNGEISDLNKWMPLVHYGSSMSPIGYSVTYCPYDDQWNLYSDVVIVDDQRMDKLSDYSETGWEYAYVTRVAFVICEALKDAFYEKNSPVVANAKKLVSGSKLTYECQQDFAFPDGDTMKSYDVSCNHTVMEAIQVDSGCVLINPCLKGNPCEHLCLFTNDPSEPYTCQCYDGYELKPGGKCADVDECNIGSHDCPVLPLGGCVNRPGTYACFCSSGYAWVEGGNCVASGGAASNLFTFGMGLDGKLGTAYQDRRSEEYAELVSTIRGIVATTFGTSVTVHDVDPGGDSAEIKVTLGADQVSSQQDQSNLAYRFVHHMRSLGKLTLEGGGGGVSRYFVGDILYETPAIAQAIAITSPCSLYDGTNFCRGSTCVSEKNGPVCQCEEGVYGEHCDQRSIETPRLTSADIGLAVAVAFLFALLCCMACWIHCIWKFLHLFILNRKARYITASVQTAPLYDYYSKPASVHHISHSTKVKSRLDRRNSYGGNSGRLK